MIEFQFFEGCPHSEKTLANLRELIKEELFDEDQVRITEILNPEEAEQLNFQGSPTILMDGIDIYNGKVPDSSSFSCRSYVFNGKRTGILSKEFIRSKFLELGKKQKA